MIEVRDVAGGRDLARPRPAARVPATSGGRARRRPRRPPDRATGRGPGQRGPGALPGPPPRVRAFRGQSVAQGADGARQGAASSRARARIDLRPPARAMTHDLVVRNIGTLITPRRPGLRLGSELAAGRARSWPPPWSRRRAGSRYVGPESLPRPDDIPPPRAASSTPAARPSLPGFVDAHTHLAFAGDRDERDPPAAGRRDATRRSRRRAAASCARVAATRAAARGRRSALLRARASTRCCCAGRPPRR